MKKNIAFFLLPFFILTSCWKTVDNLTDKKAEKQDFLVNLNSIDKISNWEKILKSWKITSASNLTITSQASWKVSKILVKEWDKVKIGQTLALLDDSILNYWLALERSKNNLERAKISYDSTLLNLDKSIEDNKISLDKAKLNHEILLKDNKLKLEKMNYDFNEWSLSNNKSKSSLDYDKLLSDLNKAKSDYDLSIKNDEITLNNFKSSIKNTYDSLNLVYFDMINLADETFWVSDKNFKSNDLFENYLWAKNPWEKIVAEQLIKQLISDYDTFKNLDFNNIDVNDFSKHLVLIESRFSNLLKLVDISKNVLKNSVEAHNFSQAQIDWLFQRFWGYWQSIQSINSWFISLNNSINSFVSTYKDNQTSRLESINILQKQVEIAYKGLESWEVTLQSSLDRIKLDIENSEKNSEINLKNLESNYNNSLKNKEISLRSLKNAIDEANVWYKEASSNYSKLVIKSPINWTVSEKYIDIWQDVWNQTKVFDLVWNTYTEVELYLTSDEISTIKLWAEVNVINWWKILKWKIDSISSVATQEFTFKTVIKILDKVNIIGLFVDVELPINLKYPLLPINIIKILPESRWIINILDNWKIKELSVDLWKTYWDKIEVVSEIDKNLNIITNDISNYNSEEFNLKINN